MTHETQEALKRAMGTFQGKLILSGYVGSTAHGTHVPKTDPKSIDDIDVMGVFVGPADHYIGLKHKEGINSFIDEWDIVLYDIKKFVHLLLKNNPNVLGTLYLAPNLYHVKTEAGQRLIDNRDLFLSKLCYKSFCGYAYSQLHRMTHMAFEGYMGDKRKQLVAEHGFDTKNAAHLIRLLRMGTEALVEGTLHVFRHDAEELKAIKRGEWTLEQVKTEAERLFKVMEEAYLRSYIQSRKSKESLDVHHKDGELSNNSQKNLETLCHPCHMKLHWRLRKTGIVFGSHTRLSTGKSRHLMVKSEVARTSEMPLSKRRGTPSSHK